MNAVTLLHQMCHDVLSQADINALGKSRGFSRQEIATRTLLENYYLSPIGVDKVLQTLTLSEVAMLHLLLALNKPVSIEIFERLYNPDYGSSRYYGQTVTQRYQPVFTQVRTQLVRKGLLLMGLSPRTDSTKMERWRFMFPSEFASFLPQPMAEVYRLDGPGVLRRDAPRKKLLALTDQLPAPKLRLDSYKLTLQDGQLYLGKRPFQAADLQKWQKARWQANTPGPVRPNKNRQLYNSASESEKRPVLEAITYALKQLRPAEWVVPKQLDPMLHIFCEGKYETETICRLGWEWGCLVRNLDGKQAAYRLADLQETAHEQGQPADYLTVNNEHSVVIDLQKIPFLALEQINQAAYLAISNRELVAEVTIICMGRAAPEALQSPPLLWLMVNVPAFAQTYKKVQIQGGKQIVHNNLHIARVKDLALRVKIERTLKAHELVVLSDEYIAFPRQALSKVSKIVTQAGHVIKTVSVED